MFKHENNKWLLQHLEGGRIALGIEGDNQFINRSLNFLYNYEVINDESKFVKSMGRRPHNKPKCLGSENFKYVKTTDYLLKRGLLREGRVLAAKKSVDLGVEIAEDNDNFAQKYAQEEYSKILAENFLGCRDFS